MEVFNEIFTTKGRLNRRLHFKYQMILIAVIALSCVTSSLAMEILTGDPANKYGEMAMGVLSLIWFGGFFILMVRRLHDMNASGGLLILTLIPLLGAFFFCYIFLAAGTVGSNKYGEEPSDFES